MLYDGPLVSIGGGFLLSNTTSTREFVSGSLGKNVGTVYARNLIRFSVIDIILIGFFRYKTDF